MIPDRIATLAIVLFVLWVLYRWAPIIFTILAFAHFWRGEWDLLMLALVYACFITLVRAGVSWRDWIVSGRRTWLRERFRSFPDATHFD